MRKLTLRLEDGLVDEVELRAREIYMPTTVWITQAIVEKLGKKRSGRPSLSDEVRQGRKKQTKHFQFAQEAERLWMMEQGELCRGSEQLWGKDEQLSSFSPLPFGSCGICRRSLIGEEESGSVRVMRHKSGAQTERDLEQVETSVAVSLAKKEERDQKRRLKG
jgi:hypothetical protein